MEDVSTGGLTFSMPFRPCREANHDPRKKKDAADPADAAGDDVATHARDARCAAATANKTHLLSASAGAA